MKFQFAAALLIANTSALQLENIQSQKFDTLGGYDPSRPMTGNNNQLGWPIKPYPLAYEQPYQQEQKKDYEFERMKFAGDKDVGKTVHIVSMSAGEYTDMPQGVRDRMKNTNDMWKYPTEQTEVHDKVASDDATAAKAKMAAKGAAIDAEVSKEDPEDAATVAAVKEKKKKEAVAEANAAAFVQVAPMNNEMVVLQVNGVPVYVNPESMLLTDDMSREDLGLDIRIGAAKVNY